MSIEIWQPCISFPRIADAKQEWARDRPKEGSGEEDCRSPELAQD